MKVRKSAANERVNERTNERANELELEKTNDEISRNGQKTSFSGIFPAFSAGKIRFSKIGLGHILDIGILH